MEYVLSASLVLLLAITGVFAWSRVLCPWLGARAWLALARRTGLTCKRRRTLGIPRWGRVLGTYRGRGLALDTYKDLGVDLCMRVVLSVENPVKGSMLVLGKQSDQAEIEQMDQAFAIVESQPEGFAEEALASADLRQQVREAVSSVWSSHYHIQVSGHTLRFEQRPRRSCFYSARRRAERLQSLLDVLCDLAEKIERLEDDALAVEAVQYV
jgi:hypothetical protein